MDNKKIKNATSTSYNNIIFKSKLEVSCYKKLETSGFSFSYEADKIVIWEGLKITHAIAYLPDKTKLLIPKTNFKIRNITYTPDFKIDYKGYTIYVDAKGFANDIYPIKKKMFIQYIDSLVKCRFFEVHSVKQMLQAIEIIKEYE